MKIGTIVISILLLIILPGLILYSTIGSGDFKRLTTLTGVYAVCRPAGYDAVCFLDADSKSGGLSCLPMAAVGGECRK